VVRTPRTPAVIIVWDTGGAEADPLWVLDAPAKAAVARMMARLRTFPAALLHAGAPGVNDPFRSGSGPHVRSWLQHPVT
jgi:hypothetical protein